MRSNTSSPIMYQQKNDSNKKASKNNKISNCGNNIENLNNNNNSSVTSSSCSRSPSPASSTSTANLNTNDNLYLSVNNQKQVFQHNPLLFAQNSQMNKGAFHQPVKQQPVLIQNMIQSPQQSILLPPPPPPPPLPLHHQQQQQQQPIIQNSQQMPASFGAKQLNKLKRFLTTLQQFAADISPEIGDRVRNLILSLIVSFSYFSLILN